MERVTPTHGCFVAFVMAVNANIGNGILVIPWAFETGGLLLGAALEGIVAVTVLTLVLQLLEAMSRTEARVSRRELQGEAGDEAKLIGDKWATPSITDRKFDVAEMVRLSYGNGLCTAYTLCYAVFIFVGNMSLAASFAITLTEFIPLLSHTCDIYENGLQGQCRMLYSLYLCAYCALMMFFSYRGYKEQVAMQVFTAAVRLTVVGVILTTSAAAISTHTYVNSGAHNPLSPQRFWQPSNSGVVFPILFLSASFHSAVPNIAQIVVNRSHNLPLALCAAVGLCFALYCSVGSVVPLAAKDVSKLASLDWKDYDAGYQHRHWWTSPVKLNPSPCCCCLHSKQSQCSHSTQSRSLIT